MPNTPIIKVAGTEYNVMDAAIHAIAKETNDTSILMIAPWVQGGYGSIANYSNPDENSNPTRIRAQIVFANPANIEIISSDTNYKYIFTAFDSSNNVIDSSATWSNNIVRNLNGCKTFRISIKRTDEGNILPYYDEFGIIVNGINNPNSMRDIFNTSKTGNIAYSYGNWQQGTYNAINNYSSPDPSNNVIRLRNEIVFDTPKNIEMSLYNTSYMFTFAAFDIANNLIEYVANVNGYHELNNVKTIRILLRKSDNSNIYLGNFFESGFYVSEHIDRVGMLFDNVADIYGKFQSGYFDNLQSMDSAVNSSTARICAKIVFDSERFVTIPPLQDGFEYMFASFESDGTRTNGNQTSWLNREYVCVNTRVLLIQIRRSDNSTINPIDVLESGFYIPVAGTHTTQKIDAGNSNIKVMAYNIGKYGYGVSSGIPSADYDEKLSNYKQFFSDQECDICGILEWGQYMDEAGTILSNNVLFNHLYPYHDDTPNSVCIKSRMQLYNIRRLTLSTNRLFTIAEIHVADKSVLLGVTHLTPNAGSTEDAARATERAELIDYLKNVPYFILFGDFNAQTIEDYDDFINAGFVLANSDYLGYQWTYSYNPADYSTDTPSSSIRYFDNIIVSSNITVVNSNRENVYADLSSDHIPFIANLSLN